MTADSETWWAAPAGNHPVDADVTLPGSKSMTNRALVLASLAAAPSTVDTPLDARDTRLMAGALTSLGTRVEVLDERRARWRVHPGSLDGETTIDCGLAGTVMRFLPPVASLARGSVTFDGDLGARRRPMGPLLEALRTCGVAVDETATCLPFTIKGVGFVRGGTVNIDVSSSSQFVSGLLLSAARFDEGLTIANTGRVVPNRPHIDMTVRMLAAHGVTATGDSGTWSVAHATVQPYDWSIEPDLSNATPFMAAALVTGGKVSFAGLGRRSVQAVEPVTALFEALGASVTSTDDTLVVSGTGTVHGGEFDLRDVGELTPTVAALALLAESPTRLFGIDYLRGHETDRLEALATEAARLGGDVVVTDDGLTIAPRPLRGGGWHTYHDHRMATAGAILGLRVPGIRVENVATTAKTLPGFTDLWRRMVEPAAA
ncbi:MAG: 3-phosphoshikimate 1-carboxyvinyltransferase [Actinomycetes bacterium]